MPFQLLAAAPVTLDTWPFIILIVCVAFVILGISLLRMHAFLALFVAAILAGVMAEKLPIDPKDAAKGVLTTVAEGKLAQAVKLSVMGFGETAGTISIVIGMATIIGMGLMESGAADKVVRRFLAVCGQGRWGVSFAIVLSTYILSIPIFFDSMFMLMLPIAMAMTLRTNRDFTLYVMSICAGGVVTHSLTVPHPGPLFMVDNLHIDVGLSIWVGVVVGFVPMLAAWVAVQWLNKWVPIPLRETEGAPMELIRSVMAKNEKDLPSLIASLTPVVLPILLISSASMFEVAKRGYTPDAQGFAGFLVNLFGGKEGFAVAKGYVDFIGNKNTALIIGAILAMRLLKKQNGQSWRKINELMGPSLETAGIMILITAAGGAFGAMLSNAGVATSLGQWAQQHSAINLIILSWFVATIFRIAQGSATVSMQTTSAMIAGLMSALPYHPMYIFLATGFGAIGFSWMNDSGFWVVSRLSGFTEKETLKTWTVLLTIVSVVGLLFTLLLSMLFPFKQ